MLSNVQLVLLILTISMRDQIETTLPGLNVRPDIGVAARVIMQPVRNQFKLLKFPPSLEWKLVARWAEAGGGFGHSGSPAHPSLTSSAHL